MITLCLAGDVMVGRGIDQALPAPGDPRLWEQQLTDATAYVDLAERRNGPVARPVPPSWPWGDALPLLDALAPDARVINVETAITDRGDPVPGKAVHYRMHPANIDCLSAAEPDACMLANNHVLDFGASGLGDTLAALSDARMPSAGAGRSRAEAAAGARIRTGGSDVWIASCGTVGSGIPIRWAATENHRGVNLLPDLSRATADATAGHLRREAGPDELTMVSIHWGPNWGYDVPREHIRFARRLIDAGVDLVYGHSAHHPLPIEIYRDKLILYGCGDLINDYEGIHGHERYRPDLRLLYLPTLDSATGQVTDLHLAPFQAHRLRLRRAGRQDRDWLRDLIAGLSQRDVRSTPDGLLDVRCRS